MAKASLNMRQIGKSEPFLRQSLLNSDKKYVPFISNTNVYYDGPTTYPEIRAPGIKKAYLPHIKHLFPHCDFLTDKHLFVTNGSIEGLDIVLKAIATPGLDFVSITHPSFSGFIFWSNLNNIMYEIVPLEGENFDCIPPEALSPFSKGLLICNPNNPTSTSISRESIKSILASFEGFVVIDEAYAEFSPKTSCLDLIDSFPRLIILRTLSKAWAAAGLRCGFIFAHPSTIDRLEQFVFPFSVSTPNQRAVVEHLEHADAIMATWPKILNERRFLSQALATSPFVEKVWPSHTNFLFLRLNNEQTLFRSMVKAGVQIVDTSHQVDKSIRISVNIPHNDDILLKTFHVDPQEARQRFSRVSPSPDSEQKYNGPGKKFG